jgi:hypothetical protein
MISKTRNPPNIIANVGKLVTFFQVFGCDNFKAELAIELREVA